MDNQRLRYNTFIFFYAVLSPYRLFELQPGAGDGCGPNEVTHQVHFLPSQDLLVTWELDDLRTGA